MDYTVWNHILYELTFSVSGEQDLDKLIRKATSAFLRKLDCAHASILRCENSHLKVDHVIPRVARNNPAYYKLIDEFERLLIQNKNLKYIVFKKDLYNYGFPLQNFGLLLIGRSEPIEEPLLKELVPVTNMLAQNCYFNLDAVRKRRALKDKLKKERHLLRVIVDTIPDLIFFKDVKGVYKVINEVAAQFFALPQEEIIGSTVWDIHSPSEAKRCRETDRNTTQTP